jgi:hypothetical protein
VHFNVTNAEQQKDKIDKFPKRSKGNAQIHATYGSQVGKQLNDFIFLRFHNVSGHFEKNVSVL